MTSRSARTARGLVAAVFSVFVAAMSHVAGGGDAPGTVGLAVALAFSAMVCVALAGRALSLPRLALSVGFSQVALHLLFTVGAGVPGAGGDGGRAGAAAISGGATGAAATAGIDTMSSMPGMSHGGSALLTALFDQGGAATAAPACSWMWVAHAVAALLTIVALRRGEAAFWGLLATARLLVLRFVRLPHLEPVAPDARLRPQRALGPDHPHPSHVFLGPLRHRGPPVFSLS